VTATVTEHLRGRKLIGIAAAGRKLKTKVITVATATGSVPGGKKVTVKLVLNRTGVALLKRYRKLKTVVTLTVAGKVVSKSSVTLTEPSLKSSKK
jgi:hypothetical protein